MKKQKMSLERMKGILSATLSRDELKTVMAGSGGPPGGGGGGETCSDFCRVGGWTYFCIKNSSGWCICNMDLNAACVRS